MRKNAVFTALRLINFNPQTPNELKIKIHVNFI